MQKDKVDEVVCKVFSGMQSCANSSSSSFTVNHTYGTALNDAKESLALAISSGVLVVPSKYKSKEVFNRIKLICNNFVGTKMDHTAICSLYSQIEEFGDFVYQAAQTKKPTE